MENKKIMAAWGAGILCSNYISNGLKDVIEVIIDNDKNKEGNIFCNMPVIHPSQIADWSQYFIIIISSYEKEIAQQLMTYGLVEERDYVSYKKYCSRPIPLLLVQEVLSDGVMREKQKEWVVRVCSKKEYDALKKEREYCGKFEQNLSLLYGKMPGRVGGYIGRCVACEKMQTFIVDYVWSDGQEPAWRETVTCPECNCNSRMRFVIDYVGKIEKDQSVFIYEAVTNTYKELQKKNPQIQGSEYLGRGIQSGQIIDGIMHQDALNLSFPNCSFDYMISNDVLEHVSDFRRALKESYRCLKERGHLILSIPIFKDREKTVVRTKMISKNKIEYILSPVYHGNPLSEEGSLVFTEFGWDILKIIKEAGFSEVFAIVYFSTEKAYFGDFPVIFEAIK